jgi:hypothetical protein
MHTGGFELASSALTSSTLKWLHRLQRGFNVCFKLFAAPPSYSACMFGEVQVKDKKDKGANAENVDAYTPKYTYYNFNN